MQRQQLPAWVRAQRWAVAVWAMVAVSMLVRFWLAPLIELLPEEAYYWTYTQHPALSYYDHPPMVAWVIAAGTALLGHTELGVRVGMIGLSLGSTLLLFAVTRLWFGRDAALAAVLLFQVLPVFLGVGMLAFPDGPLIFFWLVTLYAVSHVVMVTDQQRRAVRTAWWVVAGVGFGGAMLSKYTAILLAASLIWFLWSSRRHHWLWRWEPWLAAAIAAAAFSIVILWNAQHDWASFRFQSTRTAGNQGNPLVEHGMFWVYQVAAYTPGGFFLLSAALVYSIRHGWWCEREDRWKIVATFALPLLLVFVAASFTTTVHIADSGRKFPG
ncbi:glycosyltransferase family 39 protein, partial [bacterium]|nr:glycosyltransferase family 39 protein [bacterium]